MKKWIFIIVGLILVLGLGVVFSFIFHLNGVGQDVRTQGEQLAHSRTPITQVESVDVYYGKEECIVVQGKDNNGQSLMAWFVANTSEVDHVEKLVTQKSVVDTLKSSNPGMKILHITPGKEGTQKFWEVVFLDADGKYNYYYVDMYTGKLFRTYGLEKATS